MDQEEEKFRKLFQQLRAVDESSAPSFASQWDAAISRLNKPRRSWAAWQLSSGVAALLILFGIGWWLLGMRSADLDAPIETVRSETSLTDTMPQVSSPPAPTKALPTSLSSPRRRTARMPSRSISSARNSPNTARSPHKTAQPLPQAVLISQWRSPSESLLRTPTEQLLKRVPRLDESVVNIKRSLSNQKN